MMSWVFYLGVLMGFVVEVYCPAAHVWVEGC